MRIGEYGTMRGGNNAISSRGDDEWVRKREWEGKQKPKRYAWAFLYFEF
jgi:hypothetical protein